MSVNVPVGEGAGLEGGGLDPMTVSSVKTEYDEDNFGQMQMHDDDDEDHAEEDDDEVDDFDTWFGTESHDPFFADDELKIFKRVLRGLSGEKLLSHVSNAALTKFSLWEILFWKEVGSVYSEGATATRRQLVAILRETDAILDCFKRTLENSLRPLSQEASLSTILHVHPRLCQALELPSGHWVEKKIAKKASSTLKVADQDGENDDSAVKLEAYDETPSSSSLTIAPVERKTLTTQTKSVLGQKFGDIPRNLIQSVKVLSKKDPAASKTFIMLGGEDDDIVMRNAPKHGGGLSGGPKHKSLPTIACGLKEYEESKRERERKRAKEENRLREMKRKAQLNEVEVDDHYRQTDIRREEKKRSAEASKKEAYYMAKGRPPRHFDFTNHDFTSEEPLTLKPFEFSKEGREVQMDDAKVRLVIAQQDRKLTIYSCQKCGKGFVSDKHRGVHQSTCKSHQGLNPKVAKTTFIDGKKYTNVCPQSECNNLERFDTFELFLAHFTENHMKGQFVPTFYCHICGASFKHTQSRNEHVKYKCDKSFSCDQCEKMFATPKYLRMHVNQIHLKIATFKCNICDEKFLHNTTLQTHKQVKHKEEVTKDLTHFCEECGKGFRGWQYLKMHINANHTEEALTRKAAKEERKTSQTFLCEKCDFKTHILRNLNTHMSQVHNPLPTECPECGLVLKNERGLTSHIRNIHTPKALAKRASLKPWSDKRRAHHQKAVMEVKEPEQFYTKDAKKTKLDLKEVALLEPPLATEQQSQVVDQQYYQHFF